MPLPLHQPLIVQISKEEQSPTSPSHLHGRVLVELNLCTFYANNHNSKFRNAEGTVRWLRGYKSYTRIRSEFKAPASMKKARYNHVSCNSSARAEMGD